MSSIAVILKFCFGLVFVRKIKCSDNRCTGYVRNFVLRYYRCLSHYTNFCLSFPLICRCIRNIYEKLSVERFQSKASHIMELKASHLNFSSSYQTWCRVVNGFMNSAKSMTEKRETSNFLHLVAVESNCMCETN